MKKSQHYYYEDVEFNLDLNLQTTRRDLVDLLDEYKSHDCSVRNRLKCSCPKKSSLPSTTIIPQLNVQATQQELADLIDEHKFQDCLVCNRLKCSCSKKSSLRSTTVSEASSESLFHYESGQPSNDVYYNVAPPADALPTPRWPENITSNGHAKAASEKVSPTALNIWIRASIPNVTQSPSRVSFPVPSKELDHIDYSWPPFPESIWSEEKLKQTIARERLLSYEPERDDGSVEAFFKYFTVNRPIPKNEFAC